MPPDSAAFSAVVKDGALVANGMPRFAEFNDADLSALRQYVRSQDEEWRRQAQAAARVAIIRPRHR